MTTAAAADVRFRQLFHRHYEAVTRYCLRRLPRHDVEDAVSRVFMVAWRKIEGLPPADQVLPWLYRIASYEVSTMRRSGRRRDALRSKLDGLAGDRPSQPETQVLADADNAAVIDALESLSDSDQEVIRLRTYEDLDTAEIGLVLGCTAEAARQRLSRALRRLRAALDGGTPGPAARRTGA